MLQIYTGNGKGKTTAAVGLAIRAAGAGLKVYFAQFMKNSPSAELEIFRLIPDRIVYKQFGTGTFVLGSPSTEDTDWALRAFSEIEQAVTGGSFNVVIADELCTALHFGLIELERVLELVRNTPSELELVFTGRNAPAKLIELSDLVTEMREVKHYYQKGIQARRGIEF